MSGKIGPASRLTFRDIQDNQCWQRRLRDRHVADGVPPVPHLEVKRAEVRRISRKLAAQVILKYEWLGTMANSGLHYGIFFGSFCAGVTCVAHATGSGGVNVHREWGIDRREMTTLVRGACVHWAPPNTNSKLVSFTCRLVAEDTGAKLIIAYADTDAGEVGTIYQACNWYYVGRGASTEQYIAPNGRVYDQKIVYDLRLQHGILDRVSWSEQRKALLDAGWRCQKTNPKHRYVQVLDKTDKGLVHLVQSKARDYPKRADA
jgi:hypothetical protein